MSLTIFGKTIRKARIDTNETLLNMAKELEVSPSFLSGLETGRKKISEEWVQKIYDYFKKRKIELDNLHELAQASNEIIPVDGLPLQQRIMLAGFAKTAMTNEQIEHFSKLLEKINQTQNKEV